MLKIFPRSCPWFLKMNMGVDGSRNDVFTTDINAPISFDHIEAIGNINLTNAGGQVAKY